MKVNSLQFHDDGSNAIRLAYPAQALAAQGFDITLVKPDEEIDDAFVYIVNRPSSESMYQVICELIDSGHKVIVDVDDRFDCLPANHSMLEVAPEWDYWVGLSCQAATLVTCTTDGIADRYGYGKAIIIPNYIPESYLSIDQKSHDGPLRVGWSGTIASHPNDLQVTGDGVAKALRKRHGQGQFALIGPTEQMPRIKTALGIKPTEVALTSGWFGIAAYPHAIAQLDIGIAPLEDCEFNDSKSWLKGAEYASLGVPFVASPVTDYRHLHSYGIGLLASSHSEWFKHVNALLKSAEYRQDQAGNNRDKMKDLTIEKNAERWVDVFHVALRV